MLLIAEKGSELIDTQALTHLACLGYAVHHEEDEEIEHRHEKSMREAMSEILAAVSMNCVNKFRPECR